MSCLWLINQSETKKIVSIQQLILESAINDSFVRLRVAHFAYWITHFSYWIMYFTHLIVHYSHWILFHPLNPAFCIIKNINVKKKNILFTFTICIGRPYWTPAYIFCLKNISLIAKTRIVGCKTLVMSIFVLVY